jgi:hypothetical protein
MGCLWVTSCRSDGGLVVWSYYLCNEFWRTAETTMSTIRIQASADSGKAILRFRNGLDKPVTLILFSCLLEGTGQNWSPLLAPISLRPGEMYSADVSNSIQKLFPVAERTDTYEVRIRIRVLLLPAQPDPPRELDCTVIFYRKQFTQFMCQ